MSSVGSRASSREQNDQSEALHVKHLLPKKWKIHMLDSLTKMQNKHPNNKFLVKDLITIVSSIPESNFIQAALEIKPFKPEFVEQKALKLEVTQSTVSSTIAPTAHFKGDSLKAKELIVHKQKTTEKTLRNQFNKQYHPYRYIIKNFARLLELKYKHKVDHQHKKVDEVKDLLRKDLEIFKQFINNSISPYRKMFKMDIKQDEGKSHSMMAKFVQSFLQEHSTLNNSLHKIMLYCTRAQFSTIFEQLLPAVAEIEHYDMPEQFRIEGHYIRAIMSLMQFATGHNHQKSMNKLMQFRNNIFKDIDEYYMEKTGEYRDLEVSAEIQIEIVRFLLAKLKGWSCEIYSQLKFLELVYGDEDIACKYEHLSFIYTQLTLGFEILLSQ